MKLRNTIRLIILTITLLEAACSKPVKTEVDNRINTLSDTSEIALRSLGERAWNSVIGHDERDTIIGCFNGKETDTLIVRFAAEIEYVDTLQYITLDGRRFQANDDNWEDWNYEWDVISTCGSIPPLRVFGVAPLLVFEGDLDSNGSDEFGILFTWLTSGCRVYEIYTFYRGEWRLLIPPIDTTISLRASGIDLAGPGPHAGTVSITMSDMKAPLASCSWAPDKDTVFVASFLPLETKN